MKIQNFWAGEFHEPKAKRYLPVINPATSKEMAQIPDSDQEDMENAIQAAHEAFPAWSQMHPVKRSRLLRKMSQLIFDNLLML